MKKDTMKVPLKDIYQLLTAECRYGYTRNNHLMPSGAYDRVKEYLPKMYEIDGDFALSTARQLCEEAISDELLAHFRDGVDDQHGNMIETVQFVEWLRAWMVEFSQHSPCYATYAPYVAPYNYSQYANWLSSTAPKDRAVQ